MEYLIYKSRALVAPGSAPCRDIVGVSQRKNGDLGLTGFLHAEEGLFIQYLEGPRKCLWTLYERLHLDARHTDLALLGHGNLDKRRFQGWKMGYSDDQVFSLVDFKEQVSCSGPDRNVSGAEALYFLRVACARIDMGIVAPPLATADI